MVSQFSKSIAVVLAWEDTIYKWQVKESVRRMYFGQGYLALLLSSLLWLNGNTHTKEQALDHELWLIRMQSKCDILWFRV